MGRRDKKINKIGGHMSSEQLIDHVYDNYSGEKEEYRQGDCCPIFAQLVKDELVEINTPSE